MKIKRATLIFSVFLLNTAQAVFERQIYCFHQKTDEYSVRVALGDLLHPQDSLFFDKAMNCATITSDPRRQTLYSRLLDKKFTYDTLDNPERGVTDEASQCVINVRKVITQNQNGKGLKVGRRTSATAFESQTRGETKSQLRIQSGKKGGLSVDGEMVQLVCQKTAYQVNLEVQLQDGEENFLSTTISLRAKQEMELGKVVKDIKNKRRSMGIPIGVDWAKNEGQIENQYFISVN